MGKVVTYAIGFANRSPLGEEIKQCIREYQRYLSLENKTEAANTAVQIAESLYDQCEAIDQTLPEKDRLRDENNSLKKSLQYSEKALKTFKEERNEEQQARVLINMSKCYLKLYDYTLAILKSKEALKLYQEYNETDKYTLQSAFKLLGQIYFSKGFSADAARYDDFSNAHRFYEKEHCILKTMTAHDVDGDPNSLLILKQSSHFNMGVIQSKLPEYRQQGLKSLAICLKEAQDLELVDSQKQVLWETAQIYAGKGDYEMVKRCQEKEHNIARNNKNKEDEMNCLVARILTHLELEEYSDCYNLCELMRESIDTEDDTVCSNVVNLVIKIENLKQNLYRALSHPKSHKVCLQVGRLYLELGQIQFDEDMHRASLRTATYAVEYLENVEMKSKLCLVYTALLELKAASQWELKESEQNDYIRINNELLTYIADNVKGTRAKLDYSIQVYERCSAIYRYFKQKEIATSWDHILSIAQTEFENLGDAEDKEDDADDDDDDIDDDPMDIDIPDFSNNNNGPVSLRMSNQLLESKIKNIRVCVLLPEPATILIPIHSSGITATKIMSEASERTWKLHGVEPRISYLSVNGAEVLPHDVLDHIIKSPDDLIEAHVRGTVERSSLDCYENACSRLNITTSPLIVSRLNKQRMGILNLSGLNITRDQSVSIHELLSLTPFMTQLDLSSNMLHDEDLKILLKEIKAPRELILSNNRLTVESISTLLEMKHQTLKILKLSYNPLGSKILLELPSLFHTLKKLEVLEMEGTGLGHRLDLHNMEYDTLLTQDDQVKRKVRINIRNNHFQGNMLSEWTCKWKALPGIEALQMSGVTSDEGWEGFHQLTNFKGLKSLDFSRTVKGVLNIQDLSNFFMLDSNLHHLDLSYCNLVEHDIDMLCEGLEYNMALKSLNLKSNPKLGDRAIQKIESTDLRQLTLLNIADCGMTNQSMDVILQWIRHCKFNEIDVSENESLIQNRAQLKYLIQHYPQGRIFVFKMSLDEDISLNGLDLPTGFQIQKSLITQANPFF